jgi:hypothetical protein
MIDHNTNEPAPGNDIDYSRFDDESVVIPNQVFSVSGNKIQSLLIDDRSLRFSGQQLRFPGDFEAAWQKKWTTAAKLEVKHSSIRSITKEDQELKIRIVYRTYIGIPSECEFSFYDPAVAAGFLSYMEKEQYFTYTHERISGFKAVWRYLLGLAFTIAMTWTCWYLVVDQKHGGTDEGSDAKAQLFLYLLGLLGEKGVLAIGLVICGYIAYKIWKRAASQPFRTKLVRA